VTDPRVLGTFGGREGELRLIDSSRVAGHRNSAAALFGTYETDGETAALQSVRQERVQQRILDAKVPLAEIQRVGPGDHD
jgi:hypothetical protein